MKKLRKQIRQGLVMTETGFNLHVISKERSYEALSLGHRKEVEIPKDATPASCPFVYRWKVKLKEVNDANFTVMIHRGSDALTVMQGGAKYREYTWTGVSLRQTTRGSSEYRSLTTEQMTDISRALMSMGRWS